MSGSVYGATLTFTCREGKRLFTDVKTKQLVIAGVGTVTVYPIRETDGPDAVLIASDEAGNEYDWESLGEVEEVEVRVNTSSPCQAIIVTPRVSLGL